MAITTTFADPSPYDHIELPWDARGNAATKLRKRSAAVITWLDNISADDVLGYAGDVPVAVMVQILTRLQQQEP